MRKTTSTLLLMVAMLFVTACASPAAEQSAPAPAAEAIEPAVEGAPATATAEATAETSGAVSTVAGAAGAVGLPEVNPLEVTGDIIVAGSSTVYPLTERMAERFVDDGYAGNITIDSIGTGAGFERFCKAGETDISNASRPIRDSEIENCAAIGRTPIEFRVGTDALAIVVNPANGWVGEEGLTVEEIAKLFSAEYTNWSDVNPAWPAEPIKRFSPGTDSGTYDYFIEAVMDPAYVTDDAATEGKGEEMLLSAANLQLSEDDNVLVQGVGGDKSAIGYFGFAYFEENAGALRDLPVDGVTPAVETVNAGDYPLARPLYIYSDATVMANKPQVASFINFFLTNVNDEVIDVGYFPASDEALDTARQNWLSASSQ
jgi:phosphate transport system substrate-binding protein